jgi:hypothetical protein
LYGSDWGADDELEFAGEGSSRGIQRCIMAASDHMLAFVNQLYGSFSSGDSTVWTSRTADDVIGIGSDPEEWWEGRSVVAGIVTAQVHEISEGRTRLVAGDPRIFEHGDVFWSVDRPVLQLGDGTEVPMRVTFIAVAEEGTLQS